MCGSWDHRGNSLSLNSVLDLVGKTEGCMMVIDYLKVVIIQFNPDHSDWYGIKCYIRENDAFLKN